MALPPLPTRFLSELPPDPELQQITRAFEAGNYAQVRRLARELRSSDPEVQAAAQALLARTRPHPLILFLLALAGLILLLISWYAWQTSHTHP